MTTPKPTSRARAGFLLKAAFEVLDEAGGSLPLREVQKEVEKRVPLDAAHTPHPPPSSPTTWKSYSRNWRDVSETGSQGPVCAVTSML